MFKNIAESHTSILNVRGGFISYDVLGHGPPLVFVHAAISDRRMWDREVLSYPREFRVLRYDVRGFGDSPSALGPYSNAEDLALLLDEMGIESASLVGSSRGGHIALDFALRYPVRVRKLVLVGSGLGLFESPEEPELKMAFRDLEEEMGSARGDWEAGNQEAASQRILSLFCPTISGSAREHVAALIRRNIGEVVTDRSAQHATHSLTLPRLSSLAVPVLVLVGTNDHPSVRWSSHRLASTLPKARCLDMNGADHLPNLSASADFDTALKGFLPH